MAEINFTAYCKDENEIMVTVRNIKAPNKDHAFMAVWKMNPNLKIITVLTDEEIQWVKDLINGNDQENITSEHIIDQLGSS